MIVKRNTDHPIIWINILPIGARVLSEAESVAKHPIRDASEYDVSGVLHHDVHFIFARHTTSLQQPKTYKIRGASGALLLTWFNFNSGVDK